MHLAREELVANEEDVGQALCFVDVAKCLPCLHRYLAPLDVVRPSTKLMAMVDMAFFARRWYSLMTLGSALDGGASSDSSTISQRSMEANTISILNFQRLKFSPLNLSMTLVLSPSNNAILHSNMTSLPTYAFNQMPISA